MAYPLAAEEQQRLWERGAVYPREQVEQFPPLRYMGSKHRLLPWIYEVLADLDFDRAVDAFAGSGCVGYLMKAMGREVVANDFLEFSRQIALASIQNARHRLTPAHLARLLADNPERERFVEQTWSGIFFEPEDLRFLDNTWSNLVHLPTAEHRAVAIAALARSCVKRQPRGVFTVAGDPEKYKDGRRDLRLSLEQHFRESVEAYNATVFDNGKRNRAIRGDVLEVPTQGVDLVYMDPPYVPRSDDNCYVKRYHFLEGLASYWQGEGTAIMEDTKVKKIEKRYTPFSYRRTAVEAFDAMFRHFAGSIQVLSYSSNGYPDLDDLIGLMKRYKGRVEVHEREHRYHFGTHKNVARKRTEVQEYLVVGT